MPDRVFETERMVLRRMEMSDVDNLMGIFSDPVAMRYYPATKSRDEAEAWVRWTLGSYREHGFGQWVAMLKDSGEFAGQCGLTVQEVEGNQEVEIGYLFLRRFWGRGLATEAARTVRDHGFALGYRRLISIIDPRNLPSRRVAERTGLTLERHARKSGKEVCIYSIERAATGVLTGPRGSARANADYDIRSSSRAFLALRHRSSRSLILASSPLSFGS